MSTKKPFVVKHGLEVADNLIFAENQKVGIQTSVPDYTLDVKGDVALTGKLLVTDETGSYSTTGTISASTPSFISGVNTSLFRINDKIDDGPGGFLSANTKVLTIGISSIGISPVHTLLFGSSSININITRELSFGDENQVLFSRGEYQSPVWKSLPSDVQVSSTGSSDVNYPVFVSGTGTKSLNVNTSKVSVIPSLGNLGLGTNDPQDYRLYVEGDSYISGVLTSSSAQISNVAIGLGNTELTVDGDLRVTGVATFGPNDITIDGDNSNISIGNDAIVLDGSDNSLSIGNDAIVLDGNNNSLSIGNDAIVLDGSDNSLSIGNDAIVLDGNNNSLSIGNDVSISSGIISANSFVGDLVGVASTAVNVRITTLSTEENKYYPTFATGIGSTSVSLTTTSLFIDPTTNYLGLGTDQARYDVDIIGDLGFEGRIYAPTAPLVYASRSATVNAANANFVGINTNDIVIGDLIDDGVGGRLASNTVITSVGVGSVGINPGHTLLFGVESIDVTLTNIKYITPGRDGNVLVSSGSTGPATWKIASSLLNVGVTTTSTDDDYKIVFTSQYGESGVADLKVNEDGLSYNPSKQNLGIGKTNPQVSLDVVGDANITGVITATEFVGIASTARDILPGTYNINITGIASTATNVVGGIASITQLEVSGIATIGSATTNVTISNGNITATEFIGSGINLSGIVTQITAGIGIDLSPTNGKGVVEVKSYKPIGKTIFVSQTGSDANTGLSENHPKRTIKAAAAIAFPGDTIKVYPGVYVENNPIQLSERVSVEGTELRNCVVTPKYLNRDLFHVNNSCHVTDLSFVSGDDMTDGAAIIALQPLLGVSTDRYFDAARMIRYNLDYIAKESVGFLTSGFSGFAGNHREQDAARLIDLNLDFIAGETIGFLTSTDYKNPEFTIVNASGIATDPVNCTDDIKDILRSISYDLKAGSNKKVIGAGLSYYDDGGTLLHITGTDLNGYSVKDATVAAINHAVGIVTYVINNISYGGTTYTSLVQDTSSYSPILVSGGCTDTIDRIETLAGVVTSILDDFNNAAGITTVYGVTLESADCSDDVKDVWKCVIHDITRGGNSRCVAAGKSYYDDNWNLIPQILKNPGEVEQTVATLDYSFGIARSIINNSTWGSYPVGVGTTVVNATYDNTTGLTTITATNHGLSKNDAVKIVGLGFTCPSGPGIVTYPSGNLGFIFNVNSVVGPNTIEVIVGQSTLPHTYVSGGTVQKYTNFQNTYTQVKDLGMQPDPDTGYNNAVNGCANVVSALRSCIGVVTTIVGYGETSGITTTFPGNSGIGYTTIVGVTSAVYDNVSGETTIIAPTLSVKEGDIVEVRDLLFDCTSGGSIGTQKYPSGKYGYLFDVIGVSTTSQAFTINTGISTIPHNYVGGGYVVNRAIGVTTASYDNVTGITTITAPGAVVKVGQFVRLHDLEFSCTSGAGTTTLYPTGNLGYEFRVTEEIGAGTTFVVNTGVSTIPHTYESGGVVFPPYSPGVGPITQGPYIRNCTNFVPKSIGMKVDGFEAEPGDQDDIGVTGTMSVDSYTQYNQGGIGVSITNGAYSQLVSIFTICDDIAIFTGSGGQCDITNSNSSFGRLGLVANGVGDAASKSIYRYTGVAVTDVTQGDNVMAISGVGSIRPYDGQVCYFGELYNFVDTIEVTNGGSGYVSAPRVTISAPEGENGITAQASSEIDAFGRVTTINIVNSGTQYLNPPTVSIDPPPVGVGAAATVTSMQPIYYKVDSATLPSSGISTVTFLQTLNNTVSAGTTVYFTRVSLQITSSHSFEWVGSGNDINKAKPALGGVVIPENEVVQTDGGIVVYTSTDQAGNFRIGDGVVINQATGQISGRDFTKALFTTMTPFILALAE
jgi:hypothetical protein